VCPDHFLIYGLICNKKFHNSIIKENLNVKKEKTEEKEKEGKKEKRRKK
jgi:hypothetical protein